MKKRNHIKKISNYAMVGGLGSLLIVGLVGCGDSSNDKNQQQNKAQSDAFTNAPSFLVASFNTCFCC